jgi:hypothetical protein
LPKLHDVIVDGPGGGVSVFIAADSIDQLRPSDEAVPIQKKKLEGFELMRSESHRSAVSDYFDCLKVHRNAINLHPTGSGGRVAVTQSHSQPSQQFPRTKGFGNVIVRAHPQENEFVIEIARGGKNNNIDGRCRGFHFFAQMLPEAKVMK